MIAPARSRRPLRLPHKSLNSRRLTQRNKGSLRPGCHEGTIVAFLATPKWEWPATRMGLFLSAVLMALISCGVKKYYMFEALLRGRAGDHIVMCKEDSVHSNVSASCGHDLPYCEVRVYLRGTTEYVIEVLDIHVQLELTDADRAVLLPLESLTPLSDLTLDHRQLRMTAAPWSDWRNFYFISTERARRLAEAADYITVRLNVSALRGAQPMACLGDVRLVRRVHRYVWFLRDG